MSHIFFVLNRSDIESEKLIEFKEGLKKEFLEWGFSVSEKLTDYNISDILLVDEVEIDTVVKENASAIIISGCSILDLNMPIVRAEDYWDVYCKIDAIFISEGNMQEMTKGYAYNLFAPIKTIFDFNNLNYTEIVAFLINTNS